ncbi:MAG: hypothetical protein NHF88_00515 [Candidatus Shikimatogenerans bostrichidophilus]|nr:MAG: hypothetical protein NHF88_00515 [Candidatus Shikimatogenerans bostrichidophilus]
MNNKIFFYKKINKKNIINLLKDKFSLIINKKFNKNYILNNKKDYINFINKLEYNKINYLKNKLLIIIKKYLLIITYKYYKNKKGKNIKLKLKNIINNILILNDKYKNIYYYKLSNYTNYFKINKYYYFLIKFLILNKNNLKLKIILSRKDILFLKNLFKLEIPEISEGIIKIIKIVRIPIPNGLNKIVIYSNNKNINPIGACIGIKSIRINNILNKLDNERIELIEYSDNIYIYIKNIFYNIEIINIKIINNTYIYIIYNKKDMGKLIGKYGYNIKLCKLLLDKYKLIIKCQ